MRRSRVGISSTRVALATTVILLAFYLVIAAGVVVIVQRALTSQIDAQLEDSLDHIARQGPPPVGRGFGPPPGGPAGAHPFGPPLLVWTVHPDTTVTSSYQSAALPTRYDSVRGPVTISVGGTPIRAAGTTIGAEHVVVGISMDSVDRTRSTLVEAEAIVGPILLLVVFFLALTIGRLAAGPLHLDQ